MQRRSAHLSHCIQVVFLIIQDSNMTRLRSLRTSYIFAHVGDSKFNMFSTDGSLCFYLFRGISQKLL